MNIDPLARWYLSIEYLAFGRALERQPFAFLDRLAGARRILILGEGDGRAIARLLALSPDAQVDVFELSGKMIQLARRRIGNDSSRVSFHQQDALTASWPREHYDGVITHFFLDCFTEDEARDLVHRISAAMTHNARWLVADFAIPDNGWRRLHARLLIRIMYEFFGLTTGLRVRRLPPIERLLSDAGMQRSELAEERGGLIRSGVWTKSS
jgi:SAM-dependent methyltransferase